MKTSPTSIPIPHTSRIQKMPKKNGSSKTLIVSDLPNGVKKVDLQRHFVGAIKVTLKPCRTVANLKLVRIGEELTVNESRCMI